MHAPYCSCPSCEGDSAAEARVSDAAAHCWANGAILAALAVEAVADYLRGWDGDLTTAEATALAREALADHFRAPVTPPIPPVAASPGDGGGGTPADTDTDTDTAPSWAGMED